MKIIKKKSINLLIMMSLIIAFVVPNISYAYTILGNQVNLRLRFINLNKIQQLLLRDKVKKVMGFLIKVLQETRYQGLNLRSHKHMNMIQRQMSGRK